jgi:hypothetical protein
MDNDKSGVTILCREINKNTGEIATYVCKKDATDTDVFCVGIRSRVNPELTYYAIRTCVAENVEFLEDVLAFLKRRRLGDKAIERYGGIVQL